MTTNYAPPPPDAPPIDDHEDLDAQLEQELDQRRRVKDRVDKLRIDQLARQQLQREEAAVVELPALQRLDNFLARPLDPITHRIAGLWPIGGRVLLAAQFKAGKTTLRDNVIRSLVDGHPFLGAHHVQPVDDGTVILLDFELDDTTLQRWLTDQGLEHQDRVHVISMKGHGSTFNILEDTLRRRWAAHLAAVNPTVIVIDCVRPILDALGLDEQREGGRLLEAIDELITASGAREAFVIHHMGHAAERSRGDSRFRDWPDAEWKLVRDKDEADKSGTTEDPRGARYFSAFGRDVDHPETELTYDPISRHLTLGATAGNRHRAAERRAVDKATAAVLQAITETPGIHKRGIREYCANTVGGRKNTIDTAVRELEEAGLITITRQGQSHFHYLTRPAVPTVPDRAPGTVGTTVPRAYRGTGTASTPEEPTYEHQGHGHGQPTLIPDST